jgi:hypothetical protein
MFSILGLPDEGRDTLMSAALDPPDRALVSWRRWAWSGADARTDPVARRWMPLTDPWNQTGGTLLKSQRIRRILLYALTARALRSSTAVRR